MQYLFLSVGVAVTVLFLVFRKATVNLNVALLKSVASLLFVFTALFTFISNASCPPYMGAFTVAGACLGMLGDIYLDLKYVHSNESQKYLFAGFATFAVGHLFYSFSLIAAYGLEFKNIVFALVGAVVLGAIVPLSAKLLPIDYGKFFKVTTAYISVIGFTVGLSLSYAVTDTCLHTIIFSVAMIFFLISDAFLSGLYFGKEEKDRTNRLAIILNHLCYYAAQYIIAISLVFYRGQ